MDFPKFERWLGQLSETDRKYLRGHKNWQREYQDAQKGRKIPKGFVEKTMEILEGGSESET